MAVTNAITDLVKSVYELLASILGAAYTIIHSFINGVLGLFAGFFAFVGDIGKGVFDLVGGVGKFIAGAFRLPHVPCHLSGHAYAGASWACCMSHTENETKCAHGKNKPERANATIGNAVILAVIGAAGYAYIRFVQQPQQQQGRRPVTAGTGGVKKTN